MTADLTIAAKVQERNGGDLLAIASGGVLDIESGGAFKIAGADVTAALAAANTTPLAGIAAGYKVARGVHTQVAASDTIVTGLATVVAVVASFQSAPTIKQLFVTADIGDQAGAPVAGSILVKTFKPTAVNDVTPIAATDLSENLKVAWIAVGT